MADSSKACTRCGVVKALEEFSRRSGAKDGRQSWCKECFANCQRERLKDEGNREKKREYERERLKDPVKLEAKRNSARKRLDDPVIRESIRKYDREWKAKPENKEKASEYKRERRRNPETREDVLAVQRKYREDPAVREKEREYSRKRYEDPVVREAQRERDRKRREDPQERERARQATQSRREDPLVREKDRQNFRDWSQTPNGNASRRKRGAKYRAKKIGAEGEGLTREQLLERDGPECYICGSEPEGRDICVEHIYPLSLGGSNQPWNLLLACRTCNSHKKNKHPSDWMDALPADQRERVENALFRLYTIYGEVAL